MWGSSMLSPEYLDQAGEKVASVYRQIEADMLAYLARRMVEGDIADQRSLTALELLAQSSAPKLMEIIGEREADISRAVRLEVTDAIKRCSADDLRRIRQGLGVDLEAATTRQAALTIGGVARILARDNIDMAEGARRAFLDASTWAVMQVNSGAMTTERALHMAVRRLERDGISVVQYRNAATGAQTVANKVDVAVRRHIRTQILQDGMAMTEGIMDQAGVQLVEVSSHGGSRPSHAKWEGRVYSRHGDQVIDGVLYRDFKTACNWGDVADGIGGANCRHSYSAWFPGMKRLYEPDPPHPSGLDNAEVYELTQRQRAGEREIRATKRELAGAQMLYEKSGGLSDRAEVSRLQIRLRDQQARMRQLVAENPKVLQRSPRREWAGDMPKVTLPVKASGRKLDDLLKERSDAIKAKGLSVSEVRGGIVAKLKEQDMTAKDFAQLARKEQNGMLDNATKQSGALNNKNDPDYERRNAHAVSYYEELRNRDRGTIARKIARESSIDEKTARKAFEHLFVEEHDLEDGHRRFWEDYHIAQSVQRLLLGEGVQEHDRILFKHEALEAEYMAQGMAQGAAHDAANLRYNYAEALKQWREENGVD